MTSKDTRWAAGVRYNTAAGKEFGVGVKDIKYSFVAASFIELHSCGGVPSLTRAAADSKARDFLTFV